jgi:hypothetical protein
MIAAFKTLMYGHLANGILLFFSMYLKKIEKRNFAEATQILVIAIGYGYPILKAIYNLKIHGLQEQMDSSDMACWIYIDICFFFFWIAALHAFLFFGFWMKFKSIRKLQYDDDSEENRK